MQRPRVLPSSSQALQPAHEAHANAGGAQQPLLGASSMLVLAFGLFALSPAPLLPARRSPLAPRRAAVCRCAQSVKGFSPAYDTTVRYAAVDWARNLRKLPGSLILRRIKSPLVFNIGITMVICVIHAAVTSPMSSQVVVSRISTRC